MLESDLPVVGFYLTNADAIIRSAQSLTHWRSGSHLDTAAPVLLSIDSAGEALLEAIDARTASGETAAVEQGLLNEVLVVAKELAVRIVEQAERAGVAAGCGDGTLAGCGSYSRDLDNAKATLRRMQVAELEPRQLLALARSAWIEAVGLLSASPG
jgi:hypothetical protein